MTRVKRGKTTKKKHKRILKATKGYYGARSRLYKTAHEAYLHAGEYAFAGRRIKKRDRRALWIQRINAALKPYNMSYSKFIKNLQAARIELNRKILSELAVNNERDFKAIVEKVAQPPENA